MAAGPERSGAEQYYIVHVHAAATVFLYILLQVVIVSGIHKCATKLPGTYVIKLTRTPSSLLFSEIIVHLLLLLLSIINRLMSMTWTYNYCREWKQGETPQSNNPNNEEKVVQEGGVTRRLESNNGQQQGAEKVEESRSLLLLLATLAATVTYQAGLSPPGGVWRKEFVRPSSKIMWREFCPRSKMACMRLSG
jgi:hypothetical protein